MKLLKLKYKLIAIILAVTFISLFIYVGYVTLENVQRLRSEMKDNIMTIARVTGQNVVPELSFFDRDAAQETLGHLSTIPIIENAVLYNETGELYAQYNAPGAAAIENRPLKYGSQLEDGYFIHYEKIIFAGKWYGNILLKVSTDQLNEKIWESIIEVLVFMVFLSIVIFLLSWRLQRYISDPILLLADSFKEVSKKRDYSLQVEKTSQDEIGTLYDGFNEMMDQIQMHQQELREHKGNLENLVSRRTEEIRKKNIQLTRAKEMAENANRLKSEFLANMSHEIRTPMNAILGFTNILLEDEIDSEKQYFLETVKKSGENLLKLINDIL
ncbi:MAG: HAMP domain-containing protein, partial [bacterium]|nr:HAMP domain-containing protein [bacterium]